MKQWGNGCSCHTLAVGNTSLMKSRACLGNISSVWEQTKPADTALPLPDKFEASYRLSGKKNLWIQIWQIRPKSVREEEDIDWNWPLVIQLYSCGNPRGVPFVGFTHVRENAAKYFCSNASYDFFNVLTFSLSLVSMLFPSVFPCSESMSGGAVISSVPISA